MIVIEGIDGSGKTRLTQRLARDLGINRCHFDGPPENYKEFRARCNQSSIWFHRPVIQDRCPFISELMYAQVEDRDPYLSIQESKNALFIGLPLLVYCRPNNIFLHKPEVHEDQLYLNSIRDNWETILGLYDVYMVQMHAIRYDWTSKAEKINYDSIVELAKKRLIRAGF